MYALIDALYLGKHFVLRQESTQGIQFPAGRFDELRRAAQADARMPDWLVDAARWLWNINLAGQPMAGTVLVRPVAPPPQGHLDVTWLVNDCNTLEERALDHQRAEHEAAITRLLNQARAGR